METTPSLIRQETNKGLDEHSLNTQSSSPALERANVGQIAIDKNSSVKYWNSFMALHSNVQSSAILGKNLFHQFEEFKDGWLHRKCEQVFSQLKGVYITWIERPFVIPLKNSQSLAGKAEFMYQNVSILPLYEHAKDNSQILISIYDVTEAALKQNALRELRA